MISNKNRSLVIIETAIKWMAIKSMDQYISFSSPAFDLIKVLLSKLKKVFNFKREFHRFRVNFINYLTY